MIWTWWQSPVSNPSSCCFCWTNSLFRFETPAWDWTPKCLLHCKVSCFQAKTVDDSFFRWLPTYRQNFHLTHLAKPIHSLKCWQIDHHFVSRYMVRDYSLWKMFSNCWWWGLPGLPWLSELIIGRMFQYWHRCIGTCWTAPRLRMKVKDEKLWWFW